jgi:hypothetical protein
MRSPTFLHAITDLLAHCRKERLGQPEECTAHKIAIIFDTLVTKQIEYDDSIWATRDEHRQKRLEQKLKRQARMLDSELVPVQSA